MMKLFQRYLLINFLPPLFLSTAFFITFLLTFQLFRLVSLVISKNLEYGIVFEMMGHIALSFVPMAMPLSGLFAAIYCMNKLSEDSEVVAMRSFGATKAQLATPFLVIGALLSLSLFLVNQKMIPHSSWLFRNTIIKLSSEGALSSIKSGDFFTDIPNLVLFAENVEEGGTKLNDVFIRLNKNSEEQMIMAERGVILKQSISNIHSPMIRMHLFDGNIVKSNLESSKVEKILFKEYDFPISSGGAVPGFITKDSMRSNQELNRVIKQSEDKIREIQAKGNLSEADKNEINEITRRLPLSRLELWERYNSPFQLFLLIMLGFSLGIKKGRGKSRNSSALAITILVSYYAIYFFLLSFAKKGHLPAFLPVFVPSLLLGLVNIKYYKELDWAS